MKKRIIYLSIFLISLTTLQGQVEKQSLPNVEEISNRRSSFNLDEIKVRWKKAALENCTGVPCTTGPGTASFTCGTSTVADIDGNTYNTVLIGTQCWTKENLKVTKYNDGTLIPLDASGTSTGNGTGNTWSGLTTGARTVFEHNNTYLTTYGYLYNWYAVSNSKKICPVGWHVPTDAEWTLLVKYLDPLASATVLGDQSLTAGGAMKITGPTFWDFGNIGATNSSGFSALGSGYRYVNTNGAGPGGDFWSLKENAFFWTTDIDNSNNRPFFRSLDYANAKIKRNSTLSKSNGHSIRCLKD